jgi:hypothetical protein
MHLMINSKVKRGGSNTYVLAVLLNYFFVNFLNNEQIGIDYICEATRQNCECRGIVVAPQTARLIATNDYALAGGCVLD